MPKAKIALAMPRSLLYRFQCRKKSLGNHLKVWRKKMFSLKSMTKLEALTVHNFGSPHLNEMRQICTKIPIINGSLINMLRSNIKNCFFKVYFSFVNFPDHRIIMSFAKDWQCGTCFSDII